MLVSEFIRTIQRDASETQDDTGYNNLCLSWLQDAITELANETTWKHFQASQLMSTIPNERIYDLMLNHLDIRAIISGDGNKRIQYMSLNILRARRLNLFQTGTPKYFYFEDVLNENVDSPTDVVIRIGMYPVPTVVEDYQIFTELTPASLSTSSILPVTNNLIPCLKHKMRYYIAMDDEDGDAATIHLQLYQNAVNLLKQKEHTIQSANLVLVDNDIPSYRGRFAQFDPDHFHNWQ
jgi:hypothetical protein